MARHSERKFVSLDVGEIDFLVCLLPPSARRHGYVCWVLLLLSCMFAS